jgi:hypothetical protein
MKKILLAIFSLVLAVPFLVGQIASPRKIQLVILFDTSNSMDGLINQAKSRIWSIVNETTGLRHNGQIPTLEIAVYDYGNSSIPAKKKFIRQQTAFTTDLDLISGKLFGLRTNGGDEYCGAVIEQSIYDLNWSNNPLDLKLIYIAGNEPFNQGPIDYKKVCEIASAKGIFVNTIYCGDYEQGIREFWKDGATCSRGDYFNINSNERVAQISTPYDTQINDLNYKLNGTYVSYGQQGIYKKGMQAAEDGNAMSQGSVVNVERTLVKSKSNYMNSTWDLVDATKNDSTIIFKLNDDELPTELKGKSKEEKEKYLEDKTLERQKIQEEIGKLGQEREAYIKAEKAKSLTTTKTDDFGTAISKSLKEKAKTIGYE